MTELPFVSIVVLSHRFELAIEAMRSAKAQTYPADRFEVLLKHSPPYYPEKFNQAWAGAAGKYLVFLPDDDWLAPTFLARHVEVAELAAAQLTYSDFFVADRLRLKWHLPPLNRRSLRCWCVPFMTFLVQTDFWRTIGGWDGGITYSDWDAGIRMLEAGVTYAQLERECLWTRRNHPLSGSVLMSHETHADAFEQLRAKHAAFFAADEPDQRMPPERGGLSWRPL